MSLGLVPWEEKLFMWKRTQTPHSDVIMSADFLATCSQNYEKSLHHHVQTNYT